MPRDRIRRQRRWSRRRRPPVPRDYGGGERSGWSRRWSWARL